MKLTIISRESSMSLNMPSSLLVKLAPHSERGSRQEQKITNMANLTYRRHSTFHPFQAKTDNHLDVERVEALGNANIYFVNKVSRYCIVHTLL